MKLKGEGGTVSISKVLLVDDDNGIRRIAQLVLSKKTDWELKEAESGYEALECLKTFEPDVIILDMMMPKMDGITTYRNIIAMGITNTPVIFMTAKAQTGEVDSYLNLGAAGVIIKPFAPKELADQIKAIVSDWMNKGEGMCSQV